MSRRVANRSQTDAPGQDSFLDIVANLVGILLILIMVVGVRTKNAIVEAGQQAAVAETEPEEPETREADEPTASLIDPDAIDVAGAEREAKAIENSILELDRLLKKQDLESEYRRRERDRVQLLITTAERKLEAKKLELSEQQRQTVNQQQQLLSAQQAIDGLKSQLRAIELSGPPVEKLDHLPTPMAKTVFGKEEHFQLEGGRLSHVPWDDLVSRLKEDAPNKIWKLKDAPRITETIGPMAGFRLRYTLKKSEQLIKTDGGGMARQERASLDFFHLIPIEDELGTPVAEAMNNPSSQLNNVLGANDPKTTTITVWVYPDSFEQFRELKEYLFQGGFLTASRPMPNGRYMGGAPEGQRSASQ